MRLVSMKARASMLLVVIMLTAACEADTQSRSDAAPGVSATTPARGGPASPDPAWDYGPPGLIGPDAFKGTLPGYVYAGSGWQGDLDGYHYLIAVGSAPPTEAQKSAPGTYEPLGKILRVKNPLETAPADATPGLPEDLALPRTPGPLRVESVRVPFVTVTGPTGSRFVVNVITGSVR